MEAVGNSIPSQSQIFSTTRWGMLEACGHADQAIAKQALAEICQSYWLPIYAVIRHRGHSPPEAEDLTQDFFVKILKGRWIELADQSRGRFRSYLLTALRHFLADSRRRRLTLRHGRNFRPISIDAARAESGIEFEAFTEITAETLYDQKWAQNVIAQTLNQLRIEMSSPKKAKLFAAYREVIFSDVNAGRYVEMAHELQMSVGALQTAISRLRSRVRTLLREEVARTLASHTETETDLEMRYLLNVASKSAITSLD